MNYVKVYQELVKKAKARDVKELTLSETHHVKPRCLGGLDEESNIVRFTPKEHYIAHRLLIKLFPNNQSLKNCLTLLKGGQRWRKTRRAYNYEARTCLKPGCGNVFQIKERLPNKYCCQACASSDKGRIKALKREGLIQSAPLWVNKECPVCGNVFRDGTPNRSRVTCSKRCSYIKRGVRSDLIPNDITVPKLYQVTE